MGDDHTLERCRTEFWQPKLLDRSGLEAWWGSEQRNIAAHITQRWQELLACHQDSVPYKQLFVNSNPSQRGIWNEQRDFRYANYHT